METVARITLIYLFILAGMRMLGKREFGQLSPHEFVILLIIPEIVSTSLNQDDQTLTNAILGCCTIFVLVFLTSLFSHRFKTVEKLVTDAETVLVHRGQVFAENLDRERVTPEEIMAEAHKSGIDSVERIKWAVLESDGKIAIVPEKPEDARRPEAGPKK